VNAVGPRDEVNVTDGVAATQVDDDALSSKGLRTRARLIDAARAVFQEQGYINARISDITDRAGLSKGLFYHYFDTKEELFRMLAEEVDERLAQALSDVILGHATSASTPRERVREAMRMHYKTYSGEVKMLLVIEEAARHDQQVEALRRERYGRYTSMMEKSIRQLQARGLADPQMDPPIAAAALGSVNHRFGEVWLVQGDLDGDFDHIVDQISRFMANALQLPDEPSQRRERRTRKV
jgi:AcrR family transcriptional regulator